MAMNQTSKNMKKENKKARDLGTVNPLPEKAPKIISETEDYLVIDKPAGLPVHGGGNIKEPTLVDWLIANYPKIKKVGEDPLRPGIVHRLDKDVSGLMIIAKNNKSFQDLKSQFQERTVIKEYTALAHGKIAKDDDVIDFSIKRSRDGYRMAAMPENTEELFLRRHPSERDQGNIEGLLKSRAALTEFTVLKRFVNYTLLHVRIKTGRTHQIRVHLFAYGHPLAGDNLYCTKKTEARNKKLGLDRVFLVSDHLIFRDRQKNEQEFRLSLPRELTEALPRN